jgi:DNA polymerase (family 10)
MSVNRELARIFNSMADILEARNTAWKPRAYRSAARSLEVLGKDVREIHRGGGLPALEEIEGIGESLGRKIVQYLETGKIEEYESLKKSVPPGLRDLMEVPGLGPKKAKRLQQSLGLESVEDLGKAVRDHRVAGLAGFGKKSEEKIGENLGLRKAHLDRIPLAQAASAAQRVVTVLKGTKEIESVEAVGSIRRGEPSVGDIDILAVSESPALVMESFAALPFVKKIISKGLKKTSVLLNDGLQVDLRVFQRASTGAARLYFTGNKEHNIALRRAAQKRGYKLNEYGLFGKDGKRLAGKTEVGIYLALGFNYIPPGMRKGGRELEDFRLKPAA